MYIPRNKVTGWYGGICWFCLHHNCTDLHFHHQYTNDLSQHPHPHWLLFNLGMREAMFHQVENYTDLKLLFKNVETQGGSSQQWTQVGKLAIVKTLALGSTQRLLLGWCPHGWYVRCLKLPWWFSKAAKSERNSHKRWNRIPGRWRN